MKIRKRFAVLVAVIVLAGAVALSIFISRQASIRAQALAATETTEKSFAVSTTLAVRGDLKDYLDFGGDVVARTSIDALPDASGRVTELRISVGDRVEKDQVLAMVDPSRPGMNFAPSPVRAPISGTVTAVSVVPGSMVAPQISLARIGRMDTLEITTQIPERYVSKIRRGLQASLRFDAWPGVIFPARVTEVAPVLDATSRTMTVKLMPVNQDERIKAGMFARIRLVTDTRSNIVKIPQAAVISRFADAFIFVISETEKTETADDGTVTTRTETRVTRRPVTPGIRVDDKMEILSGLSAGEELVVRGQSLLEDGSLVTVVSQVAPLSAGENDR